MDRLLTPEEVCQRYSIKKNTLYQWTSRKLIPYLKRGGLRFKENELEKWENSAMDEIKLI